MKSLNCILTNPLSACACGCTSAPEYNVMKNEFSVYIMFELWGDRRKALFVWLLMMIDCPTIFLNNWGRGDIWGEIVGKLSSEVRKYRGDLDDVIKYLDYCTRETYSINMRHKLFNLALKIPGWIRLSKIQLIAHVFFTQKCVNSDKILGGEQFLF